MEKDRQERCCICGNLVRFGGHDPWPVSTFGRCCDNCNYGVVLPRRIKLSKWATSKIVERIKDHMQEPTVEISENAKAELLDALAWLEKGDGLFV